MEYRHNLLEYYDEFYAFTPAQQEFFVDLAASYPSPAKLLRVGCGTGSSEHKLAKCGIDVTGIDEDPALIASASRKSKLPTTSIHFFKMRVVEMSRFLGKNFYSIISCLFGHILFVHDETLLRKFFCDCKQLLVEGGTLVLHLANLPHLSATQMYALPEKESTRTKMIEQIVPASDENAVLNCYLETSSGKYLPIHEQTQVYPLTKEKLTAFGKGAGFTDISFFGGFDKASFTPESPEFIALLT